jgi:nicotinamide mononucleotide transporter
LTEILQQFIAGIQQTTLPEYIAVFAGIASVWYSRQENILVYPIGLINTVIYIYLSAKGSLFGEVSVNFYYTIMNVYGWYLWLRKDREQQTVLHITFSNRQWWAYQAIFFLICYVILYFSLSYLKQNFAPDAIPWADAFASATAFTGMWLMTKKKVESWYWWIATNIASVPLYFVKQYVFTSVYYLVLLVMAFFGLITWMQKAKDPAK